MHLFYIFGSSQALIKVSVEIKNCAGLGGNVSSPVLLFALCCPEAHASWSTAETHICSVLLCFSVCSQCRYHHCPPPPCKPAWTVHDSPSGQATLHYADISKKHRGPAACMPLLCTEHRGPVSVSHTHLPSPLPSTMADTP